MIVGQTAFNKLLLVQQYMGQVEDRIPGDRDGGHIKVYRLSGQESCLVIQGHAYHQIIGSLADIHTEVDRDGIGRCHRPASRIDRSR